MRLYKPAFPTATFLLLTSLNGCDSRNQPSAAAVTSATEGKLDELVHQKISSDAYVFGYQLVHKGGHEYTGVATVSKDGEHIQIAVNVTLDEDGQYVIGFESVN